MSRGILIEAINSCAMTAGSSEAAEEFVANITEVDNG